MEPYRHRLRCSNRGECTSDLILEREACSAENPSGGDGGERENVGRDVGLKQGKIRADIPKNRIVEHILFFVLKNAEDPNRLFFSNIQGICKDSFTRFPPGPSRA